MWKFYFKTLNLKEVNGGQELVHLSNFFSLYTNPENLA